MANQLSLIALPALMIISSVVSFSHQVFAADPNYPAKSPNDGKSKLLNSQSKYLAQSNLPQGCWALNYSSFGTIHSSVLVFSGYSGVMVTAFFNSDQSRTEYVKQSMEMRNSIHGLLILGSNPVNASTGMKQSNYNADSFLFQVSANGEYLFATCDDAGLCSPVEARTIECS